MSKTITFADLESLLFEVGFKENPTAGNNKLFEHSISDTVLILPMWQATDQVDRVHLVAVRRMLDEKGVIDADAFDELLQAAHKVADRTLPLS